MRRMLLLTDHAEPCNERTVFTFDLAFLRTLGLWLLDRSSQAPTRGSSVCLSASHFWSQPSWRR